MPGRKHNKANGSHADGASAHCPAADATASSNAHPQLQRNSATAPVSAGAVSCLAVHAKACSGYLATLLDSPGETDEDPQATIDDAISSVLTEKRFTEKTMRRVVEFWTHHAAHPELQQQWETAFPAVQRDAGADYMSSLAMPRWDQAFFKRASTEDGGHHSALELLAAAHFFDSPLLLQMVAAFIASYMRVAAYQNMTQSQQAQRAQSLAQQHAYNAQQQAYYDDYGQVVQQPAPGHPTNLDPFSQYPAHALSTITDMLCPKLNAVLAIKTRYPPLFDAAIHAERFFAEANELAIPWNQPNAPLAELLLKRLDAFPMDVTLPICVDNMHAASGDMIKLRNAISTCHCLSLSASAALGAIQPQASAALFEQLLNNTVLRRLTLSGAPLLTKDVLQSLHMLPLDSLRIETPEPPQIKQQRQQGYAVQQQAAPAWATLPSLPDVETLQFSEVINVLPAVRHMTRLRHVLIDDSTFASPKVLVDLLASNTSVNRLSLRNCTVQNPGAVLDATLAAPSKEWIHLRLSKSKKELVADH